MSIKDLISLANEFEQVSEESKRTMQGPQSKIEPTQRSKDMAPPKMPDPESYESTMDFVEIARVVHKLVQDNLSDLDKLGHIKSVDYAGHFFEVRTETPAQGQNIYKRIILFLRNQYPTTHSRADFGWIELRYPQDDCVITSRNSGNHVTFKITTIEQ